jgi:hypothetical protein
LENEAPHPARRANPEKIPCIFPVIREFGTRDRFAA